LAQALLAWAAEHNIDPVKTESVGADADTTTVTFTELDLGYYLIESSLGALVALDSTIPDAQMYEKNEEVSVDKVIVKTEDDKTTEEDESEYVKSNEVSVGDVVPFQTTIHAKPGAQEYVLHDKLSEGLTYNNDAAIADLRAFDPDGAENQEWDYKVVSGTEQTDPCAFEIVFSEKYLSTITTATDIVVTYSATLNDKAVIEGTGNPNETWLKYGTDSSNESNHSTTVTYTWGFDVKKINNENEALKGAKFTLAPEPVASAEPEPLTFTKEADAETEDAVYRYDLEGTVTELETPKSGYIYIKGIKAGTYILTETEAPDGYNKLESPITVEIIANLDNNGEPDGTITIKMNGETVKGNHAEHYYQNGVPMTNEDGSPKLDENDEPVIEQISSLVYELDILNQKGTELPSTGGIGTTIFYIVGSMMAVGAGIILVTKKRLGVEA